MKLNTVAEPTPMAAIIGRTIVGALGAASAYGAYHLSTKAAKPIETEITQQILLSPASKKATLAAVSIGALALAYRLLRKKTKEREYPITLSSMTTAESLVAGSIFSERPVPTFQGFVARKVIDSVKGETLEIVGCCVRTEYGIWVPLHVLGYDVEEMFLIGRKVIRAGKGGVEEVHIPTVSLKAYYNVIQEAEQFGSEIICIPLEMRDIQQLGLTVGRFTVLSERQLVTITGPGGKSSMGELRAATTIGALKYGGSTQAGFSGAPYVLNGRIVGIHLYGGAGGNGGQEIAYLNQLFKIMRGMQDESLSADSGAKIMEMAFKRNKDLSVEEHGDFFVYRDDTGHYHRVQKRTYYELQNKYNVQAFEDATDDEWSDNEYMGADPDEWDRYQKRGREESRRVVAEAKRPFLYQASKRFPQGRRIQSKGKSQRGTQKHIAFLEKRLEQLKSSQKLKQCPPPTQQVTEHLAPSTSNLVVEQK